MVDGREDGKARQQCRALLLVNMRVIKNYPTLSD